MSEGAVQRGFQKRSLEVADETPAQKQVKRVVEENKDYYERMNIDDQMNKAIKDIADEGGFDAVYDNLIKKSSLSELTENQAQRMLSKNHYGTLLSQAIKDGDKAKSKEYYNRINALQDITSKDATAAGQGSAILAAWKFWGPEGTVYMFKQKLDEHNKGLFDRKKGLKKGLKDVLDTANGEDTVENKRKKIRASLKRMSTSSREKLGLNKEETDKTNTLADDIIDMAETGILTDEKLKELVAEKLGIAKPLTPEQAEELKKMAEAIQKYKGKETLEQPLYPFTTHLYYPVTLLTY